MHLNNFMELEYNTQREKLIISEYGRHIQKMVEFAVSLEDKEKRQKTSESIINLMGELNPHLRDVEDFKHKLWDHLFIISDFKLDVDSPFPKPKIEDLFKKPDPLNYPNQKTSNRKRESIPPGSNVYRWNRNHGVDLV